MDDAEGVTAEPSAGRTPEEVDATLFPGMLVWRDEMADGRYRLRYAWEAADDAGPAPEVTSDAALNDRV